MRDTSSYRCVTVMKYRIVDSRSYCVTVITATDLPDAVADAIELLDNEPYSVEFPTPDLAVITFTDDHVASVYPIPN